MPPEEETEVEETPEVDETTEVEETTEVDEDDKPMTRKELREFLAAEAAKKPPAKKAAPAKKATAAVPKPVKTTRAKPDDGDSPEVPASTERKRGGVSRAWFGKRAE